MIHPQPQQQARTSSPVFSSSVDRDDGFRPYHLSGFLLGGSLFALAIAPGHVSFLAFIAALLVLIFSYFWHQQRQETLQLITSPKGTTLQLVNSPQPLKLSTTLSIRYWWSYGLGSKDNARASFLHLEINDSNGQHIHLWEQLPPWRSVPQCWPYSPVFDAGCPTFWEIEDLYRLTNLLCKQPDLVVLTA